MPRAHALLLESVHASAREELARHDVVVESLTGALDRGELVARLSALRGDGPILLGIRSKTHVRAEVFDAVPRLAAIGAFCIGTDQIDLDRAAQHGVAVFNAPFSSTRSVAELVVGEVIALSRQLFARSRAAHEGRWDKSATGAHEVRGKTLGIVGYGHIGSQVSVLAEALGMRVLYHDIAVKLPLGNAEGRDTLPELLAECDFVTLHVPDTELTRGMIDATALGHMRPGAYLLNLSRGQVVDIAALRGALVEGRLAGAAVDVFPVEPAVVGDAFESPLRGLDNVILSPHIGGSTVEAQANIGREVAGALSRFLVQGTTLGCVTLPEQDAPPIHTGARILDVHRNVPGVLSHVNRVVAESGFNIVGQRLATRGELGALLVDVDVGPADPRLIAVSGAIGALASGIRTRIVGRRH